ncbi:Tfp pilus assembly protein PilV [Burkholderiales bacterium JOSHI_001]|nr:Tfp pilus assembly protein PilV [Burkholderiales bacterium JOSHI_001]
MLNTRRPAGTQRTGARGFGLIDALVAMVILAVGMLALVRMQTRLVAQSTDTQVRLTATRLADELLSTALVDRSNANCYTVPPVGACGSPTAAAQTASWKERVKVELPEGAASSVLAVGQTNPLTVTLTWTGKGSNDLRTLKVTTDVSP